jgi:hypothetical protein
MTRWVLSLALPIITLSLTLPVQAQNGTLTRSFVSSAGLDTNSCMITAPCASFAEAYTKIGANGIIAALDPGKYGPLTITGPVTVNGNGWAAVTAPAQGDGFVINAGSGNVALIGLEIDGAGAANNGIHFESGSTLTVTNCILQNFVVNNGFGGGFSGNGILIAPSSGALDFAITNTTVSNNPYAGLNYAGNFNPTTVTGVIDGVTATANGTGINISMGNGTATSITVSNSIASGNSSSGINPNNSSTGTLVVSIDNSIIANNSAGVLAQGTAEVTLGRSVVTANVTGVANSTSPNTVYSYGDNEINLNTNNNDFGGATPGTFQSR